MYIRIYTNHIHFTSVTITRERGRVNREGGRVGREGGRVAIWEGELTFGRESWKRRRRDGRDVGEMWERWEERWERWERCDIEGRVTNYGGRVGCRVTLN